MKRNFFASCGPALAIARTAIARTAIARTAIARTAIARTAIARTAIMLAAIALVGSGSAHAADLAASYDFTDGSGSTLKDKSGHGNDGIIHGARWLKAGRGFALSFDGVDDYVDCGNRPDLDITGPVTLEAWFRAPSRPSTETGICGKFYESYALTYYLDGNCYWYINSGGNNAKAIVPEDKWVHIVGTFDGAKLRTYVNGTPTSETTSKFDTVNHGGNFYIGRILSDANAADPAYGKVRGFTGLIGAVNVYRGALNLDEIRDHYRTQAARYGVDTTWFDRVRVTPYGYFNRNQIVARLDYKGIFPIEPAARVRVELLPPQGGNVLRTTEVANLPAWGTAEATFDTTGLKAGHYLVRASYLDGKTRAPATMAVAYTPSSTTIASPRSGVVKALPPAPKTTPYEFRIARGGGFTVRYKGQSFPFASTYSFPHGGANALSAAPRPDAQGEKEWKVSVKKLSPTQYRVLARGRFYTIERTIHLFPNRVNVQDKITNTGPDDVGIIVHNEANIAGKTFGENRLAGFKTKGRTDENLSPTVFVGNPGQGLGILPLDDLYIVQCAVYNQDNRIGVSTDRFGLRKGGSYTLEWAAYPSGTGDYYDFINEVRRDEKRNGRIEGQTAFYNIGRDTPRDVPGEDYIGMRGTKYLLIRGFNWVSDDPTLSPDSLEFMGGEYPVEMEKLRKHIAAIRRAYPGLRVTFHLAHSEWATNKPDKLFPDSKLLGPNGQHLYWGGNTGYFTQQRLDEGWNWYMYYPFDNNSFRKMMMDSVDVITDKLGANAIYMDGFMIGYISKYSYDHWDGHTVEIDPQTKTIKRKLTSVLWESQPSLMEYARRMHAKGALVIANNSVITRTVGRATKIVHEYENGAGPQVHLAPTAASLIINGAGGIQINDEVDVYHDVLGKLKWGNLPFYYQEGKITHPSLPREVYPITFEELHEGYVKGKERLVTMLPGVYGWRGDRNLHFGYKCDPRGVFVPQNFLTTVDNTEVRTRVDLGQDESTVLKKIPVTLATTTPVNLNVRRYDKDAVQIDLNGNGKATLTVRSGDFALKPKTVYTVGKTRVRTDAKGILSYPFQLHGPLRLTILR